MARRQTSPKKDTEYKLHRIAIRKGCLADRGITKEWQRRRLTHETTLIGSFIEDLYDKLAEEGEEDIDLLTLPTRIAYAMRIEKIFFAEHEGDSNTHGLRREQIIEVSDKIGNDDHIQANADEFLGLR